MATISNTPRPGYIWDATDNVWYPIGVGAHQHTNAADTPAVIPNALVDAKGDLLTATADNTPARLAVGANNTVLTADSSTATGLKWAAGGKVLQVVQATTATQTIVATTTYTDTTLTATITPTSATSKILIFVNQAVYASRTNAAGTTIRILRGATTIWSPDTSGYSISYTDGANIGDMIPLTYLDSPATTSATTYKTQGRTYDSGSSGVSTFQNAGVSQSVITLMEIGA
jgi:hypothetical protein